MMQPPNHTGFTLIELLIVITIIAFLTGIALPTYQNSVLRSGRAEAKSGLLQVASDQERYFSNFNTYVDDALPLNTPVLAGRDRTTVNGLYTISVNACAGGTITNCFLATATAAGIQTGDTCTTLTLSSVGARDATGDTTNECWQR